MAEVPQSFSESTSTQQNCFGYFLDKNDYTQAPCHNNLNEATKWLQEQPFFNMLAQDGIPALYFPYYPHSKLKDFHWAFLTKARWAHKRGQMAAQLEKHLSLSERDMADYVIQLGYESPIYFNRAPLDT